MSKTENKETVENELVVLEEVKYPVSTDEIKNFLEEFKDVPTIDPEAENAGELYQLVLKGHKRAVKFRTSIEKKRKELKAPALEYGKNVDAIAKEFQSMVNTKELELFTQRKLVEDNEQRKQDELIAKERERVDTINKKIEEIRLLPLNLMGVNSDTLSDVIENLVVPTIEVFEESFDIAIATHNAALEQLKQARDTKTLAENAEHLQAEQEVKQKEEAVALEAERAKEREAFEAEKVEFAKQKTEQDRQLQEQQEEINRQNAEREAEELGKLQETERLIQEKEDSELFLEKYNNTLFQMESYESIGKLLDAIVDGTIVNVKWEV